RDRPPRRQDPGERAEPGADVAVLRGRQGQGRTGAGPGQEGARQAPGHGQARRRAGDGPGGRLGPEGQAVVGAPNTDEHVPDWVAELDIPGLVDLHTHFLPERVLTKVWAFFDQAEQHYGMAWPVHYR